MMSIYSKAVQTLCVGLLVTVSSSYCLAQTLNVTFKLVVGFPAGTSPDIAARIVAPVLSKNLGAPVIVENKPGAGGNIGVAQVASATDGLSLGLTTNGPLTTSAMLYSNPGFKASSDLIPLSLVATSPLVLVVSGKSSIDSVKDLGSKMRSSEKGLTFGSAGIGSGSHLTGELFGQSSKLPLVHVPYTGFPAVLSDVAGERVDFAFVAPSIADPFIKSGRVKALGVTSKGLYAGMPTLKPVASNAGFEGFASEVWLGMFQSKKAPLAVRNKVCSAVSLAMGDPDVRRKLSELGWSFVGGSDGALSIRMIEDTNRFGALVRRLNLKLD
jgi:tripartite-type tricarboxylate transporter receptor subunit TctC